MMVSVCWEAVGFIRRRSSAWLEQLLHKQWVTGSNPVAAIHRATDAFFTQKNVKNDKNSLRLGKNMRYHTDKLY